MWCNRLGWPAFGSLRNMTVVLLAKTVAFFQVKDRRPSSHRSFYGLLSVWSKCCYAEVWHVWITELRAPFLINLVVRCALCWRNHGSSTVMEHTTGIEQAVQSLVGSGPPAPQCLVWSWADEFSCERWAPTQHIFCQDLLQKVSQCMCQWERAALWDSRVGCLTARNLSCR